MLYTPTHHYRLHETRTYNSSLGIMNDQTADQNTNHEYIVFYHQQFEFQCNIYQITSKKYFASLPSNMIVILGYKVTDFVSGI